MINTKAQPSLMGKLTVTLVVTGSLIVGLLPALSSTPASAAPAAGHLSTPTHGGTHDLVGMSHAGRALGIVATHTGRFGYRERVFSRRDTSRIANSPVWDTLQIISAVAGIWGIPFAVAALSYKVKAQEAVRYRQCFALVRPFYGSPEWPARTSWGCR